MGGLRIARWFLYCEAVGWIVLVGGLLHNTSAHFCVFTVLLLVLPGDVGGEGVLFPLAVGLLLLGDLKEPGCCGLRVLAEWGVSGVLCHIFPRVG